MNPLGAGAAVFLATLSLQFIHPLGWVVAAALGITATLAVMQAPRIREAAHAGAVEKELPAALRAIAARMTMGASFEEALGSLSEGFGELSRELKRATRDMRTQPVPEALLALAGRVGSKQFKRACLLLADCYEKGSKPEHLQQLASETEDRQLQLAREYSATLAMASIAFVAVSALFPALFQAYVIVGSRFLSSTVTPLEALLVPVLAFPAVDLLVLGMARWRKPWEI
jgi:Flp pilus assembly protein TadB